MKAAARMSRDIEVQYLEIDTITHYKLVAGIRRPRVPLYQSGPAIANGFVHSEIIVLGRDDLAGTETRQYLHLVSVDSLASD